MPVRGNPVLGWELGVSGGTLGVRINSDGCPLSAGCKTWERNRSELGGARIRYQLLFRRRRTWRLGILTACQHQNQQLFAHDFPRSVGIVSGRRILTVTSTIATVSREPRRRRSCLVESQGSRG